MPGCLLAIDVGNTNITLGAFSGGRLARQWRLKTDAGMTARQLGLRISSAGFKPHAVACASVVPALNAKLEGAVRRQFGLKAFWVTPRSPLGLAYGVKKPAQVGADRVANAVAALVLFGAPAVVVDFGTATTFDCISRGGAYLGGAILPGPRMAARALAEQTARLPEVPVRKPLRVVGRDTVECIQAGLYFGYLGMVEKVLALTLKEMGEPRAHRIFTGGLAGLFKADLAPGGRWAPDLTLQGIRFAHEIINGERQPCSKH